MKKKNHGRLDKTILTHLCVHNELQLYWSSSNLNTQVFGYGPFSHPCNSHKPSSSSAPIPSPRTAAGSSHRSRMEKQTVDCKRQAHRRCTHRFWSFCTCQWRVGSYSRLCIFHPQWPTTMHPRLSHIPTVALREMLHRFFLDTFWWEHRPPRICTWSTSWSDKVHQRKKKTTQVQQKERKKNCILHKFKVHGHHNYWKLELYFIFLMVVGT